MVKLAGQSAYYVWFMKYFENECKKLAIPLYVLLPKRPQCNGGVERANRIFREEFYGWNDLTAESVGGLKLN